MVLFLSITKIKLQSTHADMILKRKFTLVRAHSYSCFIPSKELSSSTGSLWLNASLCTSSPFSSSFSGHPLADAVNSSPFFHSAPSAFMDHCMFVVRVEEKGRVAEGELVEASLPSSTTRVIFSHPTPWSSHVALTLHPCRQQHKLTSIKPGFLFFFFSFLYLSNFFFKNTRLRSELIIGMCGAWKLHTIVQRDHNCICVCVSIHMCNGDCALIAKKQLLKWLIRQIA